MNRNYFAGLREEKLALDKILEQKSSRYTLWRTLTFIAMLFAFAAGYDGYSAALLAGLLLLAGFALMVRRHIALQHTIILNRSYLAVLSCYLDRFDGKWQAFRDNGSQYLSRKLPQDTDLNLLGANSFYQYVSNARTRRGRDRLSEALSVREPRLAQAKRRQENIQELLKNPQLLLDLQAKAGLLPDGHDTTKLIEDMEAELPRMLRDNSLGQVACVLPILLLLSTLLMLADVISYTTPAALLLLQLLLSWIYVGRNNQILEPLLSLKRELHLYEELFALLEQQKFSSPGLRAMQTTLHTGGAVTTLHRLSLLTDCVTMRQNLAFFVLANALLLWDFHCAQRFLRQQKKLGESLRSWLDVWSEWEVLLSLSSIGMTRSTFCFPRFLEDTSSPTLQGQEITSLLLPEAKAVPNDAQLKAGTFIITGSNMSGKTTYMRTLAGSLVLALAGAPVCAKEFSLTPMMLFTSMRVSDDLENGISTFYAEILRIKQMVSYSKKQLPMMVCVDEIFKGTNSADRIVGAREAIRHLTRPWCITIVTTHDFELCNLSSPNELPIINYHFEEHYQDNKILFDYKRKDGPCQTTNAQYLLKMAGIITE